MGERSREGEAYVYATLNDLKTVCSSLRLTLASVGPTRLHASVHSGSHVDPYSIYPSKVISMTSLSLYLFYIFINFLFLAKYFLCSSYCDWVVRGQATKAGEKEKENNFFFLDKTSSIWEENKKQKRIVQANRIYTITNAKWHKIKEKFFRKYY